MKLNWFSPLPPASTDIAHYTTRVLPALAAHSAVTLWTNQDQYDASLKKYAAVRRYDMDRIPWDEINRADMCIYHIGNNPLFHGSIWQISRLHPGLVVLHDIRLHHFFDGLYRVQWRDLDAYLSVMENYYGAEGRLRAAECYRMEARNINEMAERYPLTQLAVERALGVLVHTRAAFDELKTEGRWPLAYVPLPFEASTRAVGSSPANNANADANGKPAGPPYRLIIFGYLGRNRRLEAVLKALAQLPHQDQFHLDIYGQVLDDYKHLRAEIRTHGLKRLVTVHGFVPETELDQALERAHLAINLRYPTMGEASGSQLRIWSHALPSLVTQVGWYASLPANAVAFVRPSHEVEDITSHLKAFLSEPERFAAMGERGLEILGQQHAPQTYAQAMLDFVSRTQRFGPRAVAHQLAQRAGVLMSDWLDAESADDAFQRVAAEIYKLAERKDGKSGVSGQESEERL